MPPSKKRKVSSFSDSSDSFKTKNEKTISDFLDQIDAIESSSASEAATGELVTQASSTLLVLKGIQRQVLDKHKQTTKQLEEKRQQVKKQTVLLQNLQYEKSYLESQVGTDLPTPHLDRICTVGAEQQNQGDLSIGQARNLVLCGSVKKSYEDPANHDTVMATLHNEINARGTLERDVNNAEKTLAETKKRALEKQSFLKDLPKKLEKMEQASLPLQKFFGRSSLASAGSTVHLIGTDRKKRLDLAQSLSAPLYTLFVQLQAHLDASPDDQMMLEISSSTTPLPVRSDDDEDDTEWFQSDNYALLLQLPLPDAPKKRISIEFQYLPKLRVVTAYTTGYSNNQTLLVNLFPDDTGECTWSAENVKLTNVEAKLPGRPFHWCNYLAGVHLPHASRSEVPLHLSTKVVCQELTRRVRAHTTLSHILKALEARKPIPFHPLLEQEWKDDIKDCTARLVGWTETDGETSKYERRFLAVIKRQKATLNATVTLDPTQYPTQPPTWSLLKGEENWGEKHGMASSLEMGTTPLYDSALGQIQNFVNTEFSKLVKEDVEETYDWILAHQLGKIMQLWDQSQTGTGGGVSAAAGKGKFAGVAS